MPIFDRECLFLVVNGYFWSWMANDHRNLFKVFTVPNWREACWQWALNGSNLFVNDIAYRALLDSVSSGAWNWSMVIDVNHQGWPLWYGNSVSYNRTDIKRTSFSIWIIFKDFSSIWFPFFLVWWFLMICACFSGFSCSLFYFNSIQFNSIQFNSI